MSSFKKNLDTIKDTEKELDPLPKNFKKTIENKDLLSRKLTDQDYQKKVPIYSDNPEETWNSMLNTLHTGKGIDLEGFLKPENATAIRNGLKEFYNKHPEALNTPEEIADNKMNIWNDEYTEDRNKVLDLLKKNFDLKPNEVTRAIHNKGLADKDLNEADKFLSYVTDWYKDVLGEADTNKDGTVDSQEMKATEEKDNGGEVKEDNNIDTPYDLSGGTSLDYTIEPQEMEELFQEEEPVKDTTLDYNILPTSEVTSGLNQGEDYWADENGTLGGIDVNKPIGILSGTEKDAGLSDTKGMYYGNNQTIKDDTNILPDDSIQPDLDETVDMTPEELEQAFKEAEEAAGPAPSAFEEPNSEISDNPFNIPDRVAKYFNPTSREYKVYVKGKGQQILPKGTLISPDGKEAYNKETGEVYEIYQGEEEESQDKNKVFFKPSMPDLNQKPGFSLFDMIVQGV